LNQFKTKQFLELQKKWYEKLKESGFDDIEFGEKQELLKCWESSHFYMTQDQFDNKREYYHLASQFLFFYKFESKLDRIIWKFHAHGFTYRKIARRLNAVRLSSPQNKDKIMHVIKRLRSEMKKFIFSGKASQLGSDNTAAEEKSHHLAQAANN
jgi:hypothetical protein